jgi:hypothetical protein
MTPTTTTYKIDGVTYTRWDDHVESSGMDPDTYQVHIRFSKQKNKYVIAKGPTKTTIKAVKATDVGEHTNVVTDALLQHGPDSTTMVSFKHDIQPILPWVSFPMTETDPVIVSHLIEGSHVTDDGSDVYIPRLWCFQHFFHKFRHLTLVEVHDEICVPLENWVANTPALRAEFGNDPNELFEHDKGPGVCDVEIVDDDVYVKVMYLF